MNSNDSGGGKGKGRKRVDQVERDGGEGLERNSSGVGIGTFSLSSIRVCIVRPKLISEWD